VHLLKTIMALGEVLQSVARLVEPKYEIIAPNILQRLIYYFLELF